MREGTGDQGSEARALNGRRAKDEPRAVGAHSCAGSGKERIPGPLGDASAVAGSWGGGWRADRRGQGTLPPPQLHSRLEQWMRSSRPVPFWPPQPLPAPDRSRGHSKVSPPRSPEGNVSWLKFFLNFPCQLTDSALVPTMQDSPSLKPVFQTGKLRLREHRGRVEGCLALIGVLGQEGILVNR